MRFKMPKDGSDPKTISGESDPLEKLPDAIKEIVMNNTHDLTLHLGARAEHFKKIGGDIGGEDMNYSTCALIERMAFYETMINSLIGVTKVLEERLGGVEGGDSN